MSPLTRSREGGTALIVSLIVMIVMFGLAMAYSTVSFGGYQSSQTEVAKVRSRMATQEGIFLALAELKTDTDPGGDGIGNVTFTGDDDRSISVTVQDLAGGLFRVNATGSVSSADLAAEVLVMIEPTDPLNFTTRAAVSAKGPVQTLGNIMIDGRNWDYDGAVLLGGGTFGISSMGIITNGGASEVGGYGLPPANPAPAGSQDENAVWANGVDDDGDGTTDEEPYDGIDNDGDGLIDEDVSGYPMSPDAVVGLPAGSLMAAAMAAGTYFASEIDLNAYIAANGGSLPGGEIFYLDFQKWQPADLGNTMNDPPSVIVHHTLAGNAVMKNVHGQFRGLVFTDFVEHINGDFAMIGALMSFADDTYGNTFGNGNADIRYSSEVLLNLPSPGIGVKRARILSWSHATTGTGVMP